MDLTSFSAESWQLASYIFFVSDVPFRYSLNTSLVFARSTHVVPSSL